MPSAEKMSLPFDLEHERFELTHDIDQADIIPTHTHIPVQEIIDIIGHRTHIPVVYMPLYHVSEDPGQRYETDYQAWRKVVDNVFIVNTDYAAEQNHSHGYCYDFLWNRQKAYFVDYEKYIPYSRVLRKHNVDRTWSAWATQKAYMLSGIEHYPTDCPDRFRKFLSPSRISPDYLQSRRGTYRWLLMDYMFQGDAYFSDWMQGQTLESEEPDLPINHDQFNGWWPVANHYYNTSIISVYVETLATNTAIRTLTEKTFDPLVKGHFVLPFGYPGLVADIQSYGFQLPEWIDYSYDSETDDVARFYKFTREFLRLRDTVGIEDMIELRNRDIHILHHNRQLFWDRPYASLHDVCAKFFQDHL